jgi:hypothetical protein
MVYAGSGTDQPCPPLSSGVPYSLATDLSAFGTDRRRFEPSNPEARQRCGVSSSVCECHSWEESGLASLRSSSWANSSQWSSSVWRRRPPWSRPTATRHRLSSTQSSWSAVPGLPDAGGPLEDRVERWRGHGPRRVRQDLSCVVSRGGYGKRAPSVSGSAAPHGLDHELVLLVLDGWHVVGADRTAVCAPSARTVGTSWPH